MSRSKSIRRLLGVVAAALVAIPASALAAQPVERFHDNFWSET